MIRFEPVLGPGGRATGGARPSDAAIAAAANEAAECAERQRRAEERQRAIESGRQDGYRDGWAEAQAEVKSRLERPMVALVAALEEKIEGLARLVEDCRPALAQAIVNHSVRLAEAVTGSPAAIDRRDLQERLIGEAASERGERMRLICRANPTTLGDLAEVLHRVECVCEPDAALAVGGILLFLTEPDTNRLIAEWDASVERQIASLRAGLGDAYGCQSP
jgi:flagellar biosynthesis/type III secretory pathway protein FliH